MFWVQQDVVGGGGGEGRGHRPSSGWVGMQSVQGVSSSERMKFVIAITNYNFRVNFPISAGFDSVDKVRLTKVITKWDFE